MSLEEPKLGSSLQINLSPTLGQLSLNPATVNQENAGHYFGLLASSGPPLQLVCGDNLSKMAWYNLNTSRLHIWK